MNDKLIQNNLFFNRFLIVNSNSEKSELIIDQIRMDFPDAPIGQHYKLGDIIDLWSRNPNLFTLVIDFEELFQYFSGSGEFLYIDFSKIIITSEDNTTFNHFGNAPEIISISDGFENFRNRLKRLSVQSSQLSLIKDHRSCYLVKFGTSFYWLADDSIESIHAQEGISILLLKEGYSIPVGYSLPKIFQYLDPLKFELMDTEIRSKDKISNGKVKKNKKRSRVKLIKKYGKELLKSKSRIDCLTKVRNAISLFIFVVLYILFGFTPQKVSAQPIQELMDQAIQNSQSGQYEEAEFIYAQIERFTNEYVESQYLSRAYNYSWWGKYDLAEINFKKILSENPKHQDAMLGLSFNYSWSKEFSKAASWFNKFILLFPEAKEGYVGMAYSLLNAGQLSGAAYFADQIISKFQEDSEGYYLKGLVESKQANLREAEASYRTSLEEKPDFLAAKEQLDAIGVKSSKMALSVWYGITENRNEIRNGIRRIDLKYQIKPKIGAYAYFDNSLILDNSFIAKDKFASLFALGTKYAWNDRFFTRVEIAERIIRDDPNQFLFSLENIYFINPGLVAKGLVQYDHRNKEPFGILSLGLDVGLSKAIRIEGTYFYTTQLDNGVNTNERYIVGPKFLFKNAEIVAGTYFDRIRTPELEIAQWSGLYLLSRILIGQRFETHLLFNHDKGIFDNSAKVFSIGVTYKF